MKRFVPLNKQTKKKQKAHHKAKRNSWGNISPVPRIVKSKKVYDRNRAKKESLERDLDT